MDIESWVFDLLDDIRKAAKNNENFDLHLEAAVVKDIAEAFNKTQWVEIY